MTTLQLRRLRAYNVAGWNDCQIADELGLTVLLAPAQTRTACPP